VSWFKLFRKKREEKIVTLASRKSQTYTLPTVSLEWQEKVEKIEKILNTSPVIIGIIRKYVMDVCGEIELVGNPETVAQIQGTKLWRHTVSLLPLLVRDMLVFGNAYLEKLYENGKFTDVKYVDARYIYPKTDEEGVIEVDEEGKIVAYMWKPPYLRKLDVHSTEGIEIDRDKIIHLKMLGSTGHLVGESIVLPLERLVVILGNIEHALGETAYRHAEPLWILRAGETGRRPSESMLVNLAEKFSNALERGDNVFAVPYDMEVSTITGEELSRYVKPLEVMLEEIYQSLNFAIGTEIPHKLHATTVEWNYWTDNINFLRRWVARQIEDEILLPYLEENKIDGEVRVVFKDRRPTELMSKARRISLYAKAGLITADSETENAIRRLEELPEKAT